MKVQSPRPKAQGRLALVLCSILTAGAPAQSTNGLHQIDLSTVLRLAGAQNLDVKIAREKLAEHGDAVRAAVEAGFTRFRPVCMTALAMIIGMAPMALGLGEGGEQNAPLGRAVIGGLIFATIATLMFVPVVFSILHDRHAAKAATRPPAPTTGKGAGESYA